MLAALIIIGALGIALPVVLGLIARWRKSLPEKPYVPDRANGEVNEWLLSEYGLGSRDRTLVQRTVLGRYAMVSGLDQSAGGPSPKASARLRPELGEPARALAARVVAEGFRAQRVARRLGWVQMATGVAAVAYGVGVLMGAWGDNRFLSAQALVEAGLFLPIGAFTGLIIPRRRRRLAQAYLTSVGPVTPRV